MSIFNASSRLAVSLAVAALAIVSAMQPVSADVRLHGQLATRVEDSRLVGRADTASQVSFAITLPLRDAEGLKALLNKLYDPADPLYGHYLTTSEFVDRYCPTQDDYEQVEQYVVANGFTITGTYENRLVLDVSAPTSTVESTLGVRMMRYVTAEGREFARPESEPALPAAVAARISGLVGLDGSVVAHSHHKVRAPLQPADGTTNTVSPLATGPTSGLTPAQIAAAYNLPTGTTVASGQTLALFELDGYDPKDIAAYEKQFGLPAVPIENVLIDGATGGIVKSSGGGEVTLDLELMIAAVPGATKIITYIAPNGGQGIIDCYTKIANENRAKSVSTSWGLAEDGNSAADLQAENSVFQQMAAQGQSIAAAAGDSGAYDDASVTTPTVDDPASQPYVLGVGGTSLTTSASGSYVSETTWGDKKSSSGGGGGISSVWPIPSWQQTAVTAAAGGSTSFRNVPDVSLDADPNTGYAIYYAGAWSVYGGTSAAAPLWASFLAIANQQRVAAGMSTLGQATRPLYAIGTSGKYATDFHDINDGSDNLFYKAVTGYDNATGWGSYYGSNLLKDLTTTVNPVPLITSLTPSSVYGGTGAFTLTVTGGNFVAASSVTFNGSTLPTTFTSDSSVSASVPATAIAVPGQYAVTVTNPAPGGGTSNSVNFIVSPYPVPTITSISPPSATAGGKGLTLFVTGTQFTAATSVNFNGVSYPTNFSNSTTLTAFIPASAIATSGTAFITASNPAPGGGASNTILYPVNAAATLHTFGTGLQMIAAPLDTTGYTLTNVIGASAVTLAAWNQASFAYVVGPTSVHPGQGYWVRLAGGANLYDLGSHVQGSVPYAVPMSAGWNLVGNPRTDTTSPSVLVVINAAGGMVSLQAAISSGMISGTMYTYQPGDVNYEAISLGSAGIAPYQGYWIYANTTCSLLFP